MRKLTQRDSTSLYRHVTGHAAELIASFMTDSRRRKGQDALAARERAYGLYLGWRAIAAELTDERTYFNDDRVLESLIIHPPASMVEAKVRLPY